MKNKILFIVCLITFGCKEQQTQFSDSTGITGITGISSGIASTPDSTPSGTQGLISSSTESNDAGIGDQEGPISIVLAPPVAGEEDEVNILCRKTFLVHFRFVLDITSSMRDVFPVITSNASAFAQNALAALESGSTENIVAGFSLSTFEDAAHNTPSHGGITNINSFVSTMSRVQISTRDDNGDWPENGLKAVETLLSTRLNSDALNIIIFISDNFAHRGSARFARDFSLNTLQSILFGKVTDTPILIFDSTLTSVPTDDPHLNDQILPSYATVPADQWNVLRAENVGKLIGTGIGFPLRGSALVSEIPAFIEAHKKETCI